LQEEARADSYRYAVQPGAEDGAAKPAAKAAPAKKKNKKKKKEADLDNLKQEMEMDEHKISVEELCARYGSDPVKVLTENRKICNLTKIVLKIF
jgi:sodium/potassium-transporting ATPase subunit alpha